jgi:hypothetical protein
MRTSYSSGQVLLITLLVLTVLITIGLAFIGRARTDTTISTEVEESARAFSAAEAGIEDALKKGISQDSPLPLSGVSASFTTKINSISSGVGVYAFPQVVKRGDTETLWLVNHNADQTLDETPLYTNNTIRICWKGVGGTTSPALSVIVLYKRDNQYRTARAAFDPESGRANNFAPAGSLGNSCGQSNVYSQVITFSNFSPQINVTPPNASDVLIALRLRPLYADAWLYVDSQVSLPSQGNLVTSTGTTGSGVTRKIVVLQQFRSPSSVFDAAIVSQTDFSR